MALVEETVQEETVEIRDGSFDPVRCTIEPGTAVVWRNADDTRRAIESVRFHDEASDWQFRTQPIQPGGSVEYVFDEPGVYEYFCRQEGREASGAVLVGDVSLSEPLPGE